MHGEAHGGKVRRVGTGAMILGAYERPAMTMAEGLTMELDFAAARRAMVDSQLRPSDVSDPVIIGAMAVTPREDYVDRSQRTIAYIDRAVPLGGGRWLNPPLSTGLLLSRADIRSDDRVLLIGAGTGYAAALRATMVGSVVAVEEDAALLARASAALDGHAALRLVEAPLAQGCAEHAPYTLIIIDGAIEELPPALVAQLADGGRLLTGTVEQGVTRLAIGRKHGSAFALLPFADSDIAPLPQFARPPRYSF